MEQWHDRDRASCHRNSGHNPDPWRPASLLFGEVQQLGNLILLAIHLFVLAGTNMAESGIAAMGPILIPEMEKRGYPREYATTLIAN
jgi:TRAP-type mannitol/chloroaromatic compound transport system permease large subunit